MGKKKIKTTGSNDTDVNTSKRHEEPLQAVLLADWFPPSHGTTITPDVLLGDPFRPISLQTPKVLCPLLNKTVLDYSLEYLEETCGVDELFVVCVSEQVETYLMNHYSTSNSNSNTTTNKNNNNNNNKQSKKATSGGTTSTTTTTMKISVLRDSFVTNAGDALRELDRRNWVTSDPFLLVRGDVVTNSSSIVLQALEQHKQRRAADSSCIMTCVFQAVGNTQTIITNYSCNNNNQNNNPNNNNQNNHSTDSSSSPPSTPKMLLQYSKLKSMSTDQLVIGVDPTHDNRILLYESSMNTSHVKLPCSFFQTTTTQLNVRTDLLDVGIDICSPDVLARFSDEFDYRDIRHEFVVNSAAEEEEGLQSKLFAYVLPPTEYAARVTCFPTYAAISQDLLERKCYPIVPDKQQHFNPSSSSAEQQHQNNKENSAASLHNKYTLHSHYLYEECSMTYHPNKKAMMIPAAATAADKQKTTIANASKRPVVGRSSVVKGPGMLGLGCIVGEHCRIVSTVLGRHVHIADNVHVSDSFLWDHVTIEKGAIIDHAVIANHAIIHSGAVVSKGCVIGQGCVVGKDVKLPEYTRITLAADEEDEFGVDDDEFSDDDENEDEDEDEDEFSESDDDDDDEDGIAAKKKKKDATGKASDAVNSDQDVVGPDGKGRVWKIPMEDDDDDSDDDDDDNNNNYGLTKEQMLAELLKSSSLGFDPLDSYLQRQERYRQKDTFDDFSVEESANDGKDDDFGNEDHNTNINTNLNNPFGTTTADDAFADDSGVVFADAAATSSTAGSGGDGSGGQQPIGRQKGIDVIKELKTICLEYEETSPIENLAIELNSFKFSQNATYADCTMAATLAILEKMKITPGITDGKLVADFKASLGHWAPLLLKMAIGLDEEKAIVLALDQCATNSSGEYTEMSQVLSTGMSFRFLLQTLHDEEVVSEEAILAWAADSEEAAEDSPRGKLLNSKPVQDFLEWLEEESEEEDSDEDEDEEESEEE